MYVYMCMDAVWVEAHFRKVHAELDACTIKPLSGQPAKANEKPKGRLYIYYILYIYVYIHLYIYAHEHISMHTRKHMHSLLLLTDHWCPRSARIKPGSANRHQVRWGRYSWRERLDLIGSAMKSCKDSFLFNVNPGQQAIQKWISTTCCVLFTNFTWKIAPAANLKGNRNIKHMIFHNFCQ